MSKVYADKKLGYGKIKEFEKPAGGYSGELFGDGFANVGGSGDSTNANTGNGDANDFMGEQPANDYAPQEKIPIESDIKKPDTSKPKSKPIDKPEAKTSTNPLVRPLDDKEKKLQKKEKGKNDY